MRARLRSWWQYGLYWLYLWQKFMRKHWGIAIIIALALVFAFIICAGYWLKWDLAGLISSPKKTVVTEIIRSPQEKVTTTEEGRTIWDWLQLLGVLAIPVVVGFGTLFFTRQQAKTNEANAENQQQEELLRTYFDKISDLLLDKELSTNPNIQSIVRARTLAALHILNTERKAIVLRFLHDANLLQYVKSFLYALDLNKTDLNGIDLSGATLYNTDLSGAHLRGVNLSGADLSGANLRGVNLSGVNLSGASLEGAYLRGAHLRGAHLEGLNLRGTHLRGADLRGAHLSNAYLEGAHLRGAILYGATLYGAFITREQLEEAKNITPEQFAQIKLSKPAVPHEATTTHPSATSVQPEIQPAQTSQEEAEQQEHK